MPLSEQDTGTSEMIEGGQVSCLGWFAAAQDVSAAARVSSNAAAWRWMARMVAVCEVFAAVGRCRGPTAAVGCWRVAMPGRGSRWVREKSHRHGWVGERNAGVVAESRE